MQDNTFAPKNIREGASLLKRLEGEISPITAPNQGLIEEDEPSLKQDFNGKTVYIRAVCKTKSQIDEVIGLLTAIRVCVKEE